MELVQTELLGKIQRPSIGNRKSEQQREQLTISSARHAKPPEIYQRHQKHGRVHWLQDFASVTLLQGPTHP